MAMKKLALFGAASVLLAAGIAHAQPFEAGSEARGVRGAIGLGLVGMELTMTIEAGAGVTNPWLLSLVPLAVGGGAAAGGYFMEQESMEAGVAMLAVGMTMLVPSILITLILASETFEPSETTTVTSDRASAVRVPSTARAVRAAGPALVAVRDGSLRLEVPSLALSEAPSPSLYRAVSPTGLEVQLSLVNWVF
ncbi:MAG: hypothetical protein HY905_03365 [Deltaproteobacteria bacterium]|nr:hypothetical protein [Deltaproteobacteria bacterium]